MRKLLITSIALLYTITLSSQNIDNNSQKLIETFVKSNTGVEVEPVAPEAVSKVFDGKFFKINVGFIETGSGFSYCGSANYVNINETTVKMIESIHFDVECPLLMSLIKKDFLLKDENAAVLFEAALNMIYPVDDREVQNMKHVKKGSEWIFYRSKFFDDYTAFVVTTGTEGTVTKIEAFLAYPMN